MAIVFCVALLIQHCPQCPYGPAVGESILDLSKSPLFRFEALFMIIVLTNLKADFAK
jgi:hypothetical protein